MKEGVLPKGKAIMFAGLGFIFGISVFSFGQIIPELWCLGVVIFCYFCLLISNGKIKLFFSIIFIFVLGFFLAGWRYGLSYEHNYLVKVGDSAPDFTVKEVGGKSYKLSDLKGKVVMLQFTAG